MGQGAGSRVATGRFQAVGQLDSHWYSPPPRLAAAVRRRVRGAVEPRHLVVELAGERHRDVAAQVACERAKFVTCFSRWVKGQAQGLEPGGFKLWVTTRFDWYTAPHLERHGGAHVRGGQRRGQRHREAGLAYI
jgi:hypothetical protein